MGSVLARPLYNSLVAQTTTRVRRIRASTEGRPKKKRRTEPMNVRMEEENDVVDYRPETTITVSLLEGLPSDDILRSVLIWLPASDHEHLRKSCRRIREICDSRIFVQERCVQGFAEVSVSMVDQVARDKREYEGPKDEIGEDFEDDYNEVGFIGFYGETTCEANIIVDGKNAGDIKAKLLPTTTGSFFEICDSISSDLQSCSVTFFTNQGQPTRVRSVKKAYQEFIALEPCATDSNFLYISEFELKQPYRTTSLIGSQVIKAFCKEIESSYPTEHPWSLAMYIPDSMSQEEKFAEKCREGQDSGEPAEEIFRRRQNYAISEMRMFQRAGFHQVQETVGDTSYYQVFCTPTFLNRDILKEDEVLAIPMKLLPKPSLKPSDEVKELSEYILQTLDNRKDHQSEYLDLVKGFQVPALDHPKMHEYRHAICQLGVIESLEKTLKMNVCKVNGPLKELGIVTDDIECQADVKIGMGGITEVIQLAMLKLDTMYTKISGQEILKGEQRLKDLDEGFRSKVAETVSQYGYTIIPESHAIHACSFRFDNEYINILVEFLPLDKITQVINGFDTNRRTPLMLAASRWEDKVDVQRLQIQTCQLLLRLGADRDSICDSNGCTALGHMRLGMRSSRDFKNTMTLSFNKSSDESHSRQMESLLMPTSGPTQRDNDYVMEDESDDDDN